jgi:hypothetical protein
MFAFVLYFRIKVLNEFVFVTEFVTDLVIDFSNLYWKPNSKLGVYME